MTAAPQKAKAGAIKIEAVVDAVVPVNELVTRFEFKPANGGNFPAFSGGAHTVVEMDDDGKRRLNPYSLMGDPEDTSTYSISVRRVDEGRGGSLFMHTKVKVGDAISLTYPVNLFPLDLRAGKHLFIGGGIGITPFMSMIKQLERLNGNWELHYSSRSPELSVYGGELSEKYTNFVHQYFDDRNQAIDLENLLSSRPPGTHVYVCGPAGMINWVLTTAEEMGWPSDHVHSEEFSAPPPGEPFQVRLCKSGRIIKVGEAESLLEAMEREGIDAPFQCRAGACGQCETDVRELDGEILHNDHWLKPEDHEGGNKIMPCVSRFTGKTIAIDR